MTNPIPGLRFGEFNGYPALLVSTPFSNAAISLFGAHVLSFTPTGFEDLLWLSPTSKRPPDPIRGGIPVCWPYFAKQGQPEDAPQHGLVRTAQWQVTHAQQNANGEIVLALSAPNLPEVPLSVVLTLRIGRSLEQSLTTVNLSEQTVRFTQALHTYFNVGDSTQIEIAGLDGLSYQDKYDGFNVHPQQGNWTLNDARDPGRSDRIYMNAGNHFELIDPAAQRIVTLQTEGSQSLVVWNPGAEHIKTFADLPPEGWRRYVCIEAANCGPDVIELAPDDSHALRQTLSVAPLVRH